MEIRVFVCVMCVPSIWRESFFGALHGSGVADTFRALRNECVACCFCSSTRVIEMYEYYLANIDKSNMESLHLINRQVLHAHDLFCFFWCRIGMVMGVMDTAVKLRRKLFIECEFDKQKEDRNYM